MKKVGYVLLIAGLLGLAGSAFADGKDNSGKKLNDEVITFLEGDDAVATLKIHSTFKKHGEDIDQKEGFLIWHSEAVGNVLIEPISGNDVDRISIIAIYEIKEEYVDSDLVKALVRAANRKNNLYNYEIVGNLLSIRGNVFYINNTLEVGLLIACCRQQGRLALPMLGLIDENYLSYFE